MLVWWVLSVVSMAVWVVWIGGNEMAILLKELKEERGLLFPAAAKQLDIESKLVLII